MSLFDQNLNVFRALRPNYTNKRTGKLGKYNDGGTINADVSYGLTPDYSWVRFSEDRAATRVKNLSVRREWGTPVWVEFNELTREDEVTGVHGILAPAVFGGEIAAALNNPGVPASVSTPVSANDVMPGRVVMVTSTALTVRVWTTWTPHGTYWDGSTLITITPTATSSKRSFACVGITSAGASVVTLSTDRALTYPFTDSEGALSSSGSADIKTVMDAAPTTWWVGAILISNGDAAIDPARIYDLRFWRETDTGGSGIDVDDGSTTVTGATAITFTSGATVTNNAGVAEVAISGSSGGTDYILIRDEKSSGTAGGGFTSGSWKTRTLNTEVVDTGSHASIASNQISLAAGTYRARVTAPAFECGSHQVKLYNVSDTADIAIGTSEWSGASTGNTQSTSTLFTRFTLASTKTLEVRHRCSATKTTNGFGVATSWGTEVYTVIELTREA